MSNNHHKIFENPVCPTHQMLQDYLDGKLSIQDKHLIERHLVDCEMCSDELEGLSLIKDRDKLGEIVDEIKTKPLERKSRIISFFSKYRIVASAAVFLILAALVIILQLLTDKKQKPLVAENTEVVEEKSLEQPKGRSENIIPEAEIYQETKKGMGEKREEEKTQQLQAVVEMEDAEKGVVIENDIYEVINDVAIDDDADAYVPTEITINETKYLIDVASDSEKDSNKELEEIVVVAEKSQAKSKNKNVVTQVEFKEIKKSPNQKDAAEIAMYTQRIGKKGARRSEDPGTMEKAMDKFNAEKYKSAARLFEEIVSNDSTNLKAMYYSALCNYKLENFEVSEQYLNKIVSKQENEYYSEAKQLLEEIKK